LKRAGLTSRAIAESLRVSTVLDGSVQRDGAKLRVFARLVRASDGHQLWSNRYDRDWRQLLAVQDDIARAIVEALQIPLAGGKGAQLVAHDTRDPEAHELYLKGRFFENIGTPPRLKLAVQYFHAAIDRDSMYARAYAGLADAHITLAYLFLSPERNLPPAREAVTKAVLLDSSLTDVRVSRASIALRFDWDWRIAERELAQVITAEPRNIAAIAIYAEYLQAQRRFEEAIALLRRTRLLEPLSFTVTATLGRIYMNARQPDSALYYLGEAIRLNPDRPGARRLLAHAYIQKGMFDDAVKSFRLAAASGAIEDSLMLAYGLGVSGRRVEAQRILSSMLRKPRSSYVSPFHVACAYVGIGEKDEAIRWLERGYREHAPFMNHVNALPALDPLRSDARFQDLLRRMNLAD
jgi:tetratricopeptide (TPR) repeat protein